MSCKIQTENGLEVRASNGAPSLLYQKIKTLGKSENESLKIYSVLKDIDYKKDSNGEPNLTLGGSNGHFDNLLVALATQGISIESMEDYGVRYTKRTGNKLSDNVLGVTDTVNNIIAYSKEEGSLQEESVHMATSTDQILNSSPFQRAMSLVDMTTKKAKGYLSRYGNEADARKELVDHMIVDYLAEKTFTGRIKQSIKAILNRIKALFGKPNLALLVQDIANQIVAPEFEINAIQEQQLQFMLSENAFEFDSARDGAKLEKFKKVTSKFIENLTKYANESGGFIDTKLLDKLVQDVRKGRKELVIINSVNHIQQRVKDGHERLLAISSQKNPKMNEVAEQLRKLQDVFNLYEPYIKELDDIKLDNAELKEELGKTLLDLVRYKKDFLTVRRITLGHILLPYFKNVIDSDGNQLYKDYESIEPLMLEAEELVPWEAWMSALADASDELLKVIDQYVKDTNVKVETQSKLEIKKLFSLTNKLGTKDFTKFYQKVGDTLGSYFLNRYKTEEHDANMNEMFDRLRTKYGISEDNRTRRRQFTPNTAEAELFGKELRDLLKKGELTLSRKSGKTFIPLTYDWLSTNFRGESMEEDLISRTEKAYKSEQAQWFEKNNAPVDNVEQAVEEHFDKQLDLYLIGDLAKHKPAIKAHFKNQVIIYKKGKVLPYMITDVEAQLETLKLGLLTDQKSDIYTTLYKIQAWQEQSIGQSNKGIYFKFDLSRPSDAYLDPAFDKMNKDEKNLLNYLHKLKEKNKDMSYVHALDLAPQVTKGVQERLEGADVGGMYNSVKELLTVNPDDTEFGGERKGIPIFFSSKIPSEDLSRDIPTTMAMFISMANHHVEFNKIEGVLQMGMEQLDSRTIVKQEKDEDGDIILVPTERTGGSPAKRGRTYVDMIVYKKSKAKETWLPEKWIKRMDWFMGWVSLNSLGGNMYSGVANVFTSIATRAQERIANAIVGGISNASYRKALSTYMRYTVNNIMDYGTANTNNPFTIMSQFMGIMENFQQDLVMNDEGKNRFLNAIKQLPFAPNTIGEHAVAHNTALALMEEIKLLKNGEEVSLLDAMLVVKDGVPDLTGVTTKDGKPFTLEMARRVGLTINRQNQVLFGIYNEIDKSAAQQYVLGRAISQFRKFFIPGAYRRYQKENFDHQLGIMREGMYRTSWEMLNRIRKQALQDKGALWGTTQKEWAALSDEKKKNVVRTIVELGSIAAATVFGAILTAAAEDDEDNQILAFAAYQANRHYREMSTFMFPTSLTEIMKSPAASVNQLERVLGIIGSIDPIGGMTGDPLFTQYRDGSNETKAWRNTKRLLPFYSTTERLFDATGQFNMTK